MELFENPFIDIIVRCVAVYVFMLVALRVFGKTELSQLNTLDVILILLISNSVQNAMVGSNTSLSGGLAAAAVLFALNFGLRKLRRKSKWFDDLFADKPQILIHNGTPDFKMLAKLDIDANELMEAMREHGVDKYRDVRLAMLEPDGNISIISGESHLKESKYHRKHPRKNLLNDQ